MTLTHIANLLPPLQSAIALQSWEDAEDIAREISRLARLQRLSELQKIQEAIREQEPPKVVPEGSQGAKSRLAALSPEAICPLKPEITLDTKFDTSGHDESWRNGLARDLNRLLKIGKWLNSHQDDYVNASLLKSIAARVAEFEQIQFKL